MLCRRPLRSNYIRERVIEVRNCEEVGAECETETLLLKVTGLEVGGKER